jgi:conjugal transfer ATP-binding protein TraC
MADNYSNLLNPELSVSCPFILTLVLSVEDQVKAQNEANLKFMDLEKSQDQLRQVLPGRGAGAKGGAICASACRPGSPRW